MTTLTEPTIEEQDKSPRAGEAGRVHDWRLKALIGAGYEFGVADALAGRNEIDLHDACELITKRGASPREAARILL